MSTRLPILVLLALLVCLACGIASAEEPAAGGDLRAAVQNPVGALISVPFKSS